MSASVEYLRDAAPKSKRNESIKITSINPKFHTALKYRVKFSINLPTNMDMPTYHKILNYNTSTC